MADLFWEKSTAGWWLISQTNRAKITLSNMVDRESWFQICFFDEKCWSCYTHSLHCKYTMFRTR
jgi:hypothetical protein